MTPRPRSVLVLAPLVATLALTGCVRNGDAADGSGTGQKRKQRAVGHSRGGAPAPAHGKAWSSLQAGAATR